MPSLSCPTPDLLRRLALGGLTGPDANALRKHVAECPDCSRRVASLVEVASERTSPGASPSAAGTLAAGGQNDVTLAPVGSKAIAAGFGFLAPPQRPDELGRLGPYRVLEVLGKGGMGAVFRAEDVRLARPVALKVMLPEQAERDDARERFLREARLAASLEHDNVVAIFHVDEDRGVPFIAMPLLRGSSLEDWLTKTQQNRPVEPLRVLQIGREIARGLAAAHAKGLIHRDIKPANVWLDANADDRIKILDFGLARVSHGDQNLTQSGTILGTPSYMAPEQARGEKTDGRADLFSLGVVMYRLCTGKLPFKGGDPLSTLLALATVVPDSPESINPDVPAPLANLVMRLLEKDREKRFASAQEALTAIEEAEKALTKPAKKRGGGAVLVAVVALLLAVAGGVAAYLTLWPTPTPNPKATLRVKMVDSKVRVSIANRPAPTVENGVSEFVLPEGDYSLTVEREDKKYDTNPIPLKAGEVTSLETRVSRGNLEVLRDGVVIAGWRLPIPEYPLEQEPRREPDLPREPSPYDHFRRDVLTPEQLKEAGKGDATRAPRELVGVISGSYERMGMSDNDQGGTLMLVQAEKGGKTVRFFDVETARFTKGKGKDKGFEAKLGPFPVNDAVLSHDGKLVAISHGDRDATVYDVLPKLKLPAEVFKFARANHRQVSAVFADGDRALIVGTSDEQTGKGELKMMLISRRNKDAWKLAKVTFEEANVNAHRLALSAKGTILAVAGSDAAKAGPFNAFVKLWDARTGKLLNDQKKGISALLSERHRPAEALRFSPDGKLLALIAASNTGNIDVYDVENRKHQTRFVGEKGIAAVDVAFHPKGHFSPDGKLAQRVASCDKAGNVYVWEVSSTSTRSKVFRTLAAAQVQWAPDGHHLLVRGSNGPVYVLRLSGEPGPLTELFNGENLDGWEQVGLPKWTASNGVLKTDGKGNSSGWLATKAEYSDYELSLEYRLPEKVKGNSGIFLRAWSKGAALSGADFLEVQLVDDKAYPQYKTTHRTGALVGVAAPDPIPDPSPGKWHTVYVRYEAPSVVVYVNHVRVLDVEVNRKDASSGRIGLQAYGTPVEFRNIWVRELNRPK